MATETPLISVVIPAFNRADLIEETIRSVLDQTWQNFEIIVADDGSSDDTVEVVRRIPDPRIRVLTQPNSGANTARNLGIDNAHGEYVAMLDSDDRFLPHHLEAASRHFAPNRVIYGPIIVDRGDGREMIKPPRALAKGEEMASYLMCDRGFVQTSTVVLPAAMAREVRYREGLRNGQDMDFAIRLQLHGAEFTMLPTPSAIWRDTDDPNRISASSSPELRLAWLEQVKGAISAKAYYGYRGWFIAKAYARRGNLAKALRLYGEAAVRRCYKPKLAATVAVQVLLSGGSYRKLANLYIALQGKKPRPQEVTR